MRAAVIDVGSNSIKLLVADRAPGGLREIVSTTLEVRIGTGIGSGKPSLTHEGMERGVAAISRLVSDAKAQGAERFMAVATSAVRDASNGGVFREQVQAATGLELRILTGIEEANGIGRGLTTDPALTSLRNFQVFDLGGGSLECLEFRDRQVGAAVSLPLGCVRLTEMFVKNPLEALTPADLAQVTRHVADTLTSSGFPLPAAPGTAFVGTGGTLTTARAILAARSGLSLADSDPKVAVGSLREMLALIGPIDVAFRRTIPGLPSSRADVFPTALATLVVVAGLAGAEAFQHSFRNLRWGLAAQLLD